MRSGRRMWRCTWIVVAVVAGLASVAPGVHAAPGQSVNLTAGLSTAYDSNLLQYSDQQINKFANWDPALDPGRYAIKSIDDVTFSPSLALTGELEEKKDGLKRFADDVISKFHD